MTDLLWWAGYAAGFLLTYRRAYVTVVTEMGDDPPTNFDRAMGATLSMTLCVLWPLVLAAWAVYRVATPVTLAERRAALDERDRRIRDRERELGIGEGP